MKNTSEKLFSFLSSLAPQLELPEGIRFINPYRDTEVKVLKEFCNRFYGKSGKRILILGINPGRFGGGVTGISFTDPIALESACHIKNSFEKRHELSSKFIYEMINCWGGPEKFYDNFLLSAACPLGFIKGEKNYNYYDSSALLQTCSEFIKFSLIEHSKMDINRDVVISLGKKNASMLEAFNNELKVFGKVVYLEHPRYIMQYKLKSKSDYINSYCTLLDHVM